MEGERAQAWALEVAVREENQTAILPQTNETNPAAPSCLVKFETGNVSLRIYAWKYRVKKNVI